MVTGSRPSPASETRSRPPSPEIGDPDRFETPAKKLIAYAGMDASKWLNLARIRHKRKHMSKRGSSELLASTMLAADKVRIYDPYFRRVPDSMKAQVVNITTSPCRESPGNLPGLPVAHAASSGLRVRTSRASPARSSQRQALNSWVKIGELINRLLQAVYILMPRSSKSTCLSPIFYYQHPI